MTIHLNNEGQECETGLLGGENQWMENQGKWMERLKEDEYG
jgi:hypothetical protein